MPDLTVLTCSPVDQRHWVRALLRQSWVQDTRIDGRRNLLATARLLALYADWDTLETRPTWAKLVERSGLHERTVARWLQELRVRGWLVLLEHGSTPDTRPMALAYLGNRAALYGLRIPLAPEEALARAERQLIGELELCPRESNESSETVPDQSSIDVVGDESVSLPKSLQDLPLESKTGTSRASQTVDNSDTNLPKPHKPKPSALRAGSDHTQASDLSILVPVSPFEMLVAAQWLRHRLPVFGRCSRKLVRHLCKPYWRAGWSSRDIVHAMDYRPSVFGQSPRMLISPERPSSPAQFIRSRLRAWCDQNGRIMSGYWSSHVLDVTAVRDARRRVAHRHGAAGARLLHAGERTLTAERIAEHRRYTKVAMRPPHQLLPRPCAEQARVERRAEQERFRAQLVAKARAELGLTVQTARPNPLNRSDPALTDPDVVGRALDYARRHGKAAAPRRRRRRTSW